MVAYTSNTSPWVAEARESVWYCYLLPSEFKNSCPLQKRVEGPERKAEASLPGFENVGFPERLVLLASFQSV